MLQIRAAEVVTGVAKGRAMTVDPAGNMELPCERLVSAGRDGRARDSMYTALHNLKCPFAPALLGAGSVRARYQRGGWWGEANAATC